MAFVLIPREIKVNRSNSLSLNNFFKTYRPFLLLSTSPSLSLFLSTTFQTYRPPAHVPSYLPPTTHIPTHYYHLYTSTPPLAVHTHNPSLIIWHLPSLEPAAWSFTHTHTHTHARTHARTHAHTHARTHERTDKGLVRDVRQKIASAVVEVKERPNEPQWLKQGG